jgi:sulfatase maturation enzyme AslB (radical SAM superfamily)
VTGHGTRGLCEKCRDRVPAEYVVTDGRVLLRKDCPECGITEALVSNDAEAWQRKRDLWRYDADEQVECTLHCDRCKTWHDPTLVFVDVTNRCNMSCPICIANVRGMGFEFHPPVEYFDKVFKALSDRKTVHLVELFGGEPTVREDVVEIVQLARNYGLKSRIQTNGLRLADEEYCKTLCDADVRFRIAFDGRDPEIYCRLRDDPGAYEKKLKAMANLKKYSRRKNAMLCCAARGINESHLADLIGYCHEHAGVIDTLGLIPLTENWEPGTFHNEVRTTREDVEHMIEQSVPGGRVEFIPAGMLHCLKKLWPFFKTSVHSEALMVGGAHPDCETITFLVSDGQAYRSVNYFLRMPLGRIAEEIRLRTRQIENWLARLNPANRLDRLRGKWLVLKIFVPMILRAVDFTRLARGGRVVATLRVLAGMVRGKRFPRGILRVVVLPLEEYHSVEAARLHNCKAVFAYEDVEDGQVKTIPFCMWNQYRNDILRKLTDKYGIADRAGGARVAVHPEARVGEPATVT